MAELFRRGAGRVVVGDQSGVQFVRHVADGTRFGTTRALCRENGLLAAIEESGAEAHFFDEDDFRAGWFEASLPAGSAWSEAFVLPRILQEVDHVVYLPRLSSHLFAGYTHGHKCAVGFLRDDHRHLLHNDAGQFYEKIADISHVPEIASRLRLILTHVDAMLLHAGPDVGTVHRPRLQAVIASDSLTSHDAVAVGLYLHFDRRIPRDLSQNLHYDPAVASLLNQLFVERVVPSETGIPWTSSSGMRYQGYDAHVFEEGLLGDRVLQRAWALEGGIPERIRLRTTGVHPRRALWRALRAHSAGRIVLRGGA